MCHAHNPHIMTKGSNIWHWLHKHIGFYKVKQIFHTFKQVFGGFEGFGSSEKHPLIAMILYCYDRIGYINILKH